MVVHADTIPQKALLKQASASRNLVKHSPYKILILNFRL